MIDRAARPFTLPELGDLRLAAMREAVANGFDRPASIENVAFDPIADADDAQVLRMVQAMAGFGAMSGGSHLLRRQIGIDSGVDWFAATAS